MTGVEQLRRLYDHTSWNDRRFADLLSAGDAPAEAVREFAHLIAAESLWHGRITGDLVSHAVFPQWSVDEARAQSLRVASAWSALLESLNDDALDRPITYTNSSGQTFTTPLGDILLHVALHGQYHRGKVNLLLRQAGREPVFTDYIFWVRGVPAARTASPG
jgi:uncharacterized damage-inducible protein DinB